MRNGFWLALPCLLSGCASIAQQNAERQYGHYKDRLFMVEVMAVDQDAPWFLLWRDHAVQAKAAILKSAEALGMRYEDFVAPG